MKSDPTLRDEITAKGIDVADVDRVLEIATELQEKKERVVPDTDLVDIGDDLDLSKDTVLEALAVFRREATAAPRLRKRSPARAVVVSVMVIAVGLCLVFFLMRRTPSNEVVETPPSTAGTELPTTAPEVQATLATSGSYVALVSQAVVYYDFETVANGMVRDVNKYAIHGTLNGPRQAEGKFGQGLEFDGVDDWIDCGMHEELSIVRDMTISLWVKFLGARHHDIITTKAEGWKNTRGILLQANTGSPYRQVTYTGDGTRERYATSDRVITDRVWHHIIAVAEGTTATIYIDGREATARATIGSTVPGEVPMLIGRLTDTLDNALCGTVDELAIWNRALSPEEARILHER